MREQPITTDVVVVGAGPAGLAVAACLTRAGVEHALLEREHTVAPAWRRHYDRLHLHTSRAFSSLPHRSMPRHYPRYPSREQVVAYMDDYARSEGLTPTFGVEVTRLSRDGSGWAVETSAGEYRCGSVVVATGVNGEPYVPVWPGLDSFPGTVMHSSEYRNGRDLADADVLVVGFGNSGGEIALDLCEHGARPVLSVRSAVNVVPRDILGIPVLAIAIPLSRLPSRLADALIWPVLKAYYPSYTHIGVRKAASGPFRQIARRGRIPLLDVGTVREIRRGRIGLEGDVNEVSGPWVTFEGDRRARFNAIVFATGYLPCVPGGVPGEHGDTGLERAPGLFHCGFHVAATGMLREIRIEAQEIVRRIARSGRGAPVVGED